MVRFTVLLCVLLFVLTGAEKYEKQAEKGKEAESEKPIIRILSFRSEQNVDGSYKFEYEGEDGSRRSEQGYYKDSDKSEDGKTQVMEGSYSYTDPEGELVNIQYLADENGFRPQGNIIHPSISSLVQNLYLQNNEENKSQEPVRKVNKVLEEDQHAQYSTGPADLYHNRSYEYENVTNNPYHL